MTRNVFYALLLSMLFMSLCMSFMAGCGSDGNDNSDGDSDTQTDGDLDSDDGTEDDDSSDGDIADGDLDGDKEESTPELALPFVTDENGGVLILHGANISRGAKSSPYVSNITREEIMRLSSDWGFNFARQLIIWAGVEPEAGVYDMEYLDKVEVLLDWYHEAGIKVLVDMHQDVYSEFTCGDGAPEWAVRSDGLKIECPSQWFLGYLQPGVERCFDNFWDADGPHKDLQEHYAEMWAVVVKRFKDHPAVIGWDIINEPHPGTDMDPLEALGVDRPDSPSPEFDKNKLQPFYQRVINRIRQEDSEHWIAFEPRYGAPSTGGASYFTKLDDPRDGAPRLLYAPHLYSVALENDQSFSPDTDITVEKWENHRKNEQEILESAMILGEWGLNPEWPNAQLFFRQVLEAADRQMAGWSYWDYNNGGWCWINSDGTEREAANDVVRVYPRRIAGIPQNFSFDADAKVFTLTFIDNPQITGQTEIYLPAKRFYENGWELSVSDEENSWTEQFDSETEILSITTPATEGEHTITIKPSRK